MRRQPCHAQDFAWPTNDGPGRAVLCPPSAIHKTDFSANTSNVRVRSNFAAKTLYHESSVQEFRTGPNLSLRLVWHRTSKLDNFSALAIESFAQIAALEGAPSRLQRASRRSRRLFSQEELGFGKGQGPDFIIGGFSMTRYIYRTVNSRFETAAILHRRWHTADSPSVLVTANGSYFCYEACGSLYS